MYKIKNKTKESRKFREHKVGIMHFLRTGEEVIIANAPATKRTDVFEITDLSKSEQLNEKEEPKRMKRTKLNKEKI